MKDLWLNVSETCFCLFWHDTGPANRRASPQRKAAPRSWLMAGRALASVIAAEACAFNLWSMLVPPRLSTSYRSVLQWSRFAPLITRWTVGRETRTSRAMAAGLRPASQAARISRSCPGVGEPASSGVSFFLSELLAEPGLSTRRRSLDAPSGWLRPRLRASSITAFVRRSNPSSSSKRNDRPRSAGRAMPGACCRSPPVSGFRVMASLPVPRPRKVFTVSGAGGRRGHR